MVCHFEGLAMDAAENVIPMIAKSLLVPAGEPLLSRIKALFQQSSHCLIVT